MSFAIAVGTIAAALQERAVTFTRYEAPVGEAPFEDLRGRTAFLRATAERDTTYRLVIGRQAGDSNAGSAKSYQRSKYQGLHVSQGSCERCV